MSSTLRICLTLGTHFISRKFYLARKGRHVLRTSAPTVQNIVAFFAIAIDQSSAEMKVMTVLELCANGSVDDYIFNSHIAISWRQKLELCFLISNGMAFLHSKGIMHRGQCTVHTPK